MFVPYAVDVPMQRYPYANWALIGLTVLVSIAVWKAPRPIPGIDRSRIEDLSVEEIQKLVDQIVETTAPRLSLVRGHANPLQLITYTLVHADFWHLAGNMLFLFCFGNAVNARLGHALYLALYFALGAVAGAAWLLFDPEGTSLIGASGAIMGIVGLLFVLYPRNDVSIFYFWYGGAGTWEVSAMWVILVYMALDLFGTVRGGGGVAYISHLVGALVGIGAGAALFGLGLLEPVYGEENLLQVMGFQEKCEPLPPADEDVPDLPVAGAKIQPRRPADGWGEM